MTVVDGRAIADRIEGLLREALPQRGFRPTLGSLFVGDAADSALYTRRKAEAAARLGVAFTVERLPPSATAEEAAAKIHELNERLGLDGYIVQLPLPPALRPRTDELLNLMAPGRDVDGLTEANRQRLFNKQPGAFLPTPVGAVLTILASLYPETRWDEQLQCRTGRLPELVPDELRGERATIVSDGDVFGPTLRFALESGGLRAAIVRSDDPTLRDAAFQSKLIVTAVGKPGFLTGDRVPSGAIVIDVGTTLVGGKTVGDVDWPSVAPRAAAATPVPGGVGPVTVAMLFANLLYLIRYRQERR